MADNFYKVGSDYYNATTKQKVLNLNDLNTLAKAGGKEISAPVVNSQTPVAIPNPNEIKNYDVTGKSADGKTLLGTPKPITNIVDSGTLKVGASMGSVTSQLPDGNANAQAQKLFANNSLTDAQTNVDTLKKQLADLESTRLKEVQAQKDQTQTDINKLNTDRTNSVTEFNNTTNPLYEQGTSEYGRMLDSLKQIDYTKQVQDRLSLTNDIVNYSKLMTDEIDTQANIPAIQSVSQGRTSATTEKYTSKIATAQAALQAIDGNFQLAFDIMDKGANAINQIATQRINFLTFVQGLYDTPIANKETKLLNLTTDEKALIDKGIEDAKAKIKTIEDNKAVINNLMADPTTAKIAHDSGILLTDTQDELAKKLNAYYVKNPTLVPASVKVLQEKYPDVGINYWDSNDIIKNKISNSAVFKKENPTGDISNKELLDAAQKLVENGTASDLSDAINQIKEGLGGTSKLGQQVGTIQGLPSYSTRTTNPGMTRANRNNNPGNIKVSSYTKNFDGVIGVESDPSQDGGNFLIFDSAESGINAIGKLLVEGKSYQGLTAEQAIKKYNGNGSYGASDVGLVPNKDFQSQIKDPNKLFAVATAIAQSEGFKISAPAKPKQEQIDSWVKLINLGKNKIEDVKDNNLRNEVVIALAKSGVVSSKDAQVTNTLNDNINLIDSLLTSKGLKGTVGAYGIARWTPFSPDKAERQDFIAGVNQLVDKNTIDTLLNLKKAGGTLGALSEGERTMLQSAASKIGTWAIKDDTGKITGFEISEDLFKKELNNIKTIAQRALNNAGGSNGVVNTVEQYLAQNPERVDDYNIIVKANPNLSSDEILQVLIGQ